MINLRVISIATAIAIGMLGAVQLASPESLGISAIAARWLGIVATGLGILQGFLPRVQGPTTDPETLADRIESMTSDDRATLRTLLELRHGSAMPAPSQDDRIIGLIDRAQPPAPMNLPMNDRG